MSGRKKSRSGKRSSERSRSATPGRRARSSHKGKPRIRADESMTMTELEKMAKAIGLPFGGLNKQNLVRNINKYM